MRTMLNLSMPTLYMSKIMLNFYAKINVKNMSIRDHKQNFKRLKTSHFYFDGLKIKIHCNKKLKFIVFLRTKNLFNHFYTIKNMKNFQMLHYHNKYTKTNHVLFCFSNQVNSYNYPKHSRYNHEVMKITTKSIRDRRWW
jgi:hypothetical protein